MKAIYADFIQANPNCSKFASNRDAMVIFDFLNQDTNIIRMVDFSEMGKPALSGCVLALEAFFDQMQNPTITLADGFTRTAVGRMVKTILEPFGYRPTSQKSFPRDYVLKYFTSASCYRKTGPATMQIVKRVEAIQ